MQVVLPRIIKHLQQHRALQLIHLKRLKTPEETVQPCLGVVSNLRAIFIVQRQATFLNEGFNVLRGGVGLQRLFDPTRKPDVVPQLRFFIKKTEQLARIVGWQSLGCPIKVITQGDVLTESIHGHCSISLQLLAGPFNQMSNGITTHAIGVGRANPFQHKINLAFEIFNLIKAIQINFHTSHELLHPSLQRIDAGRFGEPLFDGLHVNRFDRGMGRRHGRGAYSSPIKLHEIGDFDGSGMLFLQPIRQVHQTPRFAVKIGGKEFAQGLVDFAGSIFLGHRTQPSLHVFGVLQPDAIRIDFAVQVGARPIGNTLTREAWIQILLDGVFNGPLDAAKHLVSDAFVFDDRLPTLVKVVTLVVHDFVVFQNVLSNQEVAFFHLLLGTRDGSRQHLGLQRHAFLHAGGPKNALDPVGRKHRHQIVLEGQVETAGTGITLTS